VINGKSKDLGRYASREEAEAACNAVRKMSPAKVKSAPPVSETTQESIRSDLATGKSQRQVARVFKVSHETVRQIALRPPGSAALGRDPREPVGDCWWIHLLSSAVGKPRSEPTCALVEAFLFEVATSPPEHLAGGARLSRLRDGVGGVDALCYTEANNAPKGWKPGVAHECTQA
jgi:hypothetical protein